MLCTASKDAAMLLMQVRQIAIDEVRSTSPNVSGYPESPRSLSVTKTSWVGVVSDRSKQCMRDRKDLPYNVIEASPSPKPFRTIAKSRFRTVSVCSYSEMEDVYPPPSSSTDPILVPRLSINFSSKAKEDRPPKNEQKPGVVIESVPDSSISVSSSVSGDGMSDTAPTENKTPSASLVPHTFNLVSTETCIKAGCISTSKFVGTCVDGPDKVKDILRKKFSWKSFPELEQYLIDNRIQYLQFSNQLNYTAEQKRYNNKLTQGLLDLAAEEGYLFEGFTFAAVRDRIRCYYKSYVQATKKKKLKTKRPPVK